MADKKSEETPKKRTLKKTETVRQRSERAEAAEPKGRHLKRTAGVVGKPFKAAHRVGKKEYYLPLPDNRVGRFLNKRRRFIPSYFREAWQELRQVTWPDRRATVRMTYAVFIFSAVLILLTTVVDFGLDKVFRKVFLS